MVPTIIAISVIAFTIIRLPPGDYLTTVIAELSANGAPADSGTIASLRARYGLGDAAYVQYWRWISGILLRGDFGLSFERNVPVTSLIWDRLGATFGISLTTLM